MYFEYIGNGFSLFAFTFEELKRDLKNVHGIVLENYVTLN